ncbi:MAG TPA: hypothetical protein VIM12_10775 [Noviherbaspirillum sp.]|jgi:hypothetical protein|uniref:2-amino-5-chloromuconate deaminase CnbZ n=1 Tax=Noviherbaspirillum sp. TaxID=1926288 RepID=UPI002F9270D0
MTSSATLFEPGNYRFVPAVFQYSGGVAAEPGYRIERVRFASTVPLDEGFARIEEILRAAGRPLTAFCACELRSPAPFDEAGFEAFNKVYAGTLARWGIVDGNVNPVARSNVCPAIDPPPAPGFHAFSYTVPDRDARPSFVVAGAAEAPEGKGNYRDHIIRRGDLSAEGLRAKAAWVLNEWSGAWQRWDSPGSTRRRRSCTPCMPSIHSSPPRSRAVAPCAAV